MSAMAMTTKDLLLLRRSDATLFKNARIHLRVFVRFSAVLIILTALIAPDCCLTRSHVHDGYLDGLGSICFSRAT